ncbi:upstream activation factor subunit UAF30 [Senna tora]|uniref:Upstream activation factor subunit UAF30 n=1 Tax=Senna tora TaxID=362788 RepID=A0A835C6K6_9FABA|nr:upstream activation factor subunit UAF30 [Senna tora]
MERQQAKIAEHPEMQALAGLPEISKTQALKHIWAYIKDNNLQEEAERKHYLLRKKITKNRDNRERVNPLLTEEDAYDCRL